MVHETSVYYAHFESTISATSLKKWTKAITSAESRRLVNPRAMDIIGVHQPDRIANVAQSALDANRPPAVGTQWLDLALLIEERQYVFVPIT